MNISSGAIILYALINFLIAETLSAVSITKGPTDMQVCSNDVVDIACGFTGADPTTVPYLRIVKRNNIGGFNSIIIRGNRVTNNSVDGLVWVPDLNSGPNNSPNSKFVVGPVNRILNLSLFRCGFPVSGGSSIESSIGRLIVLGPPLIKNFTVTESCSTSLSMSWQTVSYPECGNMTYVLAVTLHRTSFMTVTTSANHHSFTGLKSNTSYNITIVPRYKGVLGSAEAITMSTTNDQNILQEVRNINAVPIQDTIDFTVSWQVPIVQCSLYTVTGYSVSVLNNEPANKTTITISNEIRLSDLVTELLPRNNYMIIVSAISIKGLGPPSAPINVTTDGQMTDDDDDDDGYLKINYYYAFLALLLIILVIVVVIACVRYQRQKKTNATTVESNSDFDNNELSMTEMRSTTSSDE
ncbi:uncharacterized protein [Dysidea avara]|uniref:uncharacterized protein n=1 Tax=Dysidea avara TaxID=196820 RepID=UPI0033246241